MWQKDCKWKMCNKKTLEQARRHFQKAKDVVQVCQDETSLSTASVAKENHVTRNRTGQLHAKDLCVWCMTGYDRIHENTRLLTMEQKKTWLKFKASILFVDNIEKRTRLRLLVDSITDPFATTIRYHLKCFKDYMRPVYEEQCDAHIQHINGADVKKKYQIQNESPVHQIVFSILT